MDHDRYFKELISNFFLEFVDLFLPDMSAYLDRDFAIVQMDKEIFTDIKLGDRHEVDLLMKVKFRGDQAFFGNYTLNKLGFIAIPFSSSNI